MADPTGGDQILDRSGDVLDRHVRAAPVPMRVIDHVDTEPLQAGVIDMATPRA